MTSTHTSIRSTTLGITLVAAFSLTACMGEDPAGFSDENVQTSSPTSSPTQSANESTDEDSPDDDDVLMAEVDGPVEFEECIEAEEMDGATVEWLDDVVIPEERHEGVSGETAEVAGQEVALPEAPDIIIPERVGQAGCIIEYPAPGGCLPAVEISGSYIPGYRVPERSLEASELPGGVVLEELVQEEITSQAVEQDGVYEDEVCQTEPDDAEEGDFVSRVFRPHIYRPHIYASHSYNGSDYRSRVTTENGDRITSQRLPSYRVQSMRVHSARVGSDHLDAYHVEGSDHTQYSEDDETTSYTTEGDVLFHSDEHTLRSDAESELQAVANDIAQRDDNYTIRVEGHTDDLPTQEYDDNDELSEQRAQTVVEWLQDNTDVASEDMTAEGMGEDHPRADNTTDDGRQQNRRVVITVAPEDYEPEIDYEVDASDTDDG